MGDALNQNGEIEDAIAAYHQAIEITPGDSILQAKLKTIKLQKDTNNKQINQNQLIQKSHKNLKVIEGKNNWLFLDNDSNQINQQLTGKKTFSETELFKWKLLLETRELLLNKYNISYCFLVVPNKGCVYSEYLPDSIKLSEDRCINQLINYLADNSFAKILYPLETLKEAKARDLPVYRLRDTHWTAFGAFIFYQYVMSQISKTVKTYILSESSVEFSQVITKISDLGDKLDIREDVLLESKISNSSSKCIFNNNVKNTGNLMVFENTNQNLPKAVLFGDSFSSQLLKFLAESFSRLVIVWQPNLDYSIILNEKPDIVISQQVERFLVKIPDDFHGLSNMDRTNLKSKI
ncbi:MAG: alginate O-acetyltransferase AlgX-related protein [Waterburya sp.]